MSITLADYLYALTVVLCACAVQLHVSALSDLLYLGYMSLPLGNLGAPLEDNIVVADCDYQ